MLRVSFLICGCILTLSRRGESLYIVIDTKKYRNLVFLLLIISVFFIWYVAEYKPKELTVVFLDVGQGDSTFIESPSGIQILIDAGANKKVLREIQKFMPFYDRSIDVVVATHPDKDHIGGIPDILKRYSVETYIQTSILDNSGDYNQIQNQIAAQDIKKIIIDKPVSMNLGDGVVLEFLFPDRTIDVLEKNTSSIIVKLIYGENEFLFTGDSPKSIEKFLVSLYGEKLESDVLKVGHHGSKTSSDYSFIEAVNPEYAIVSAGFDNRYGHPHSDVVNLFNELDIELFNTAQVGNIVFTSNSNTIILNN